MLSFLFFPGKGRSILRKFLRCLCPSKVANFSHHNSVKIDDVTTLHVLRGDDESDSGTCDAVRALRRRHWWFYLFIYFLFNKKCQNINEIRCQFRSVFVFFVIFKWYLYFNCFKVISTFTSTVTCDMLSATKININNNRTLSQVWNTREIIKTALTLTV